MTFFCNQNYVDDIRGGILCEEMGTGKTCICLALIVLTVHQRPLPPADFLPEPKRHKTLYQQCLDTIITQGIPFKHLDPRPHFYADLENATPSYLLKPPPPKRARRFSITLPPEQVYLSTSTLIVVPDTLIQQWLTEILKHVEDNVLSTTAIWKPTQSIPTVEDLLKYDILLISHSRFAKEDDDGGFEYTGVPLGCRCFYVNATRTRVCTCPRSTTLWWRSPLMQVRWKRLIIDEGHVLGTGTTRLVALAGKLRCERRWCVTGTVSNHMMGMDLGMERTLSDTTMDINGIITPGESMDDSSTEDTLVTTRKPEQLDLKRLGTILIDFLHTPPFQQGDIWQRYVVKPYTEGRPGSMSSLKSVMTLMIRHRPRDIEKDVTLPPLHTKTVLLQPTHENRLAINVITALIALNAVLTQRCDQDYMFHPSQVKFREDVVRNLMLSAFHWTGTTMESVIHAIERAETGLQKAKERGYSEEDVELLVKVVGYLKEAIHDDGWRALAVREEVGHRESPQEMGYTLDGCPEDVCDAWALSTVDDPLTNESSTGKRMFSGPALLAMQSQLATLALLPPNEHAWTLSCAGHAHRFAAQEQLEKARAKLVESQKKKDGSPKKEPITKKEIEIIPIRNDEELKLRKVVKHEIDHYDLSKSALPRKQPQHPLTPPSSPSKDIKSILKVSSVPDDIPSSSPLKKIAIRRTASAKLNYLLDKITSLHKDEKIIVFSDYGPMMWYLSECLEILDIQHLIYIQRLMPQRRSQYIVTFNSSRHYRVLIMETKVAAHGLNVTAASRVFFLNACWQRSVERQAIKRAHRIGQTREVYVETLVLRDTIEEELLIRREEMGKEQLDRTKRFTDDGKLRGIISSAKFMPVYDGDVKYGLLGRLFGTRGDKDEQVERELDGHHDKVVKKRRVEEDKVEEILDIERVTPEPLPVVRKTTRKRTGSNVVVLKIPKATAVTSNSGRKRRRVQFAES